MCRPRVNVLTACGAVQQQMPGFMAQQPNMAGYPGAAYPGMPYGNNLGYQQYGAMPAYGGMAYPGGFPAYPSFPQPAQNYPGQAQQSPYGAAPAAYSSAGSGGKPAYDANFGAAASGGRGNGGGRRGGKGKQSFGHGRGAGGSAGQAHVLPSEPFNHTQQQAAPAVGAFTGYTDPNQWTGGNVRYDGGVGVGGYKPDKAAGAAAQQYDQSAYMQQPQQNFQQYNSFQGPQQAYGQPYGGQQWGGQQDKGGYQKPF